MNTSRWILLGMLCQLFYPVAATGGQASSEASDLGPGLTPVGAERAGNADGSIPAWDGGLPVRSEGRDAGGHYADPFPEDKPLFYITGADIEKYKDFLSEGQQTLLKKQPTFKMPVYTTRRTAAYPEEHYKRTLQNRTQTKLSADGNVVEVADGGVPFPIPTTGAEAIWNFLLRYQGESFQTCYMDAPMLASGGYTPSKSVIDWDYHFASLTKSDKDKIKNRLVNFRQEIIAPPRSAGTILLVHETVDQVKEPRISWIYSPGVRRVRLSPEVAYDNLSADSDGLRTFDDFKLYNGAIDRYDWKLIGKKELYIPYNSYKLVDKRVPYRELLKPGHLNPDYLRYEKHRVWVVEATLKKGQRHIYHKRVFYIDEDSWGIAVIDKYDAKGQLWRLTEGHSFLRYDKPFVEIAPQVQYDFPSGRYLALQLSNEEAVAYKERSYPPSFFTPETLRDSGVR